MLFTPYFIFIKSLTFFLENNNYRKYYGKMIFSLDKKKLIERFRTQL